MQRTVFQAEFPNAIEFDKDGAYHFLSGFKWISRRSSATDRVVGTCQKRDRTVDAPGPNFLSFRAAISAGRKGPPCAYISRRSTSKKNRRMKERPARIDTCSGNKLQRGDSVPVETCHVQETQPPEFSFHSVYPSDEEDDKRTALDRRRGERELREWASNCNSKLVHDLIPFKCVSFLVA